MLALVASVDLVELGDRRRPPRAAELTVASAAVAIAGVRVVLVDRVYTQARVCSLMSEVDLISRDDVLLNALRALAVDGYAQASWYDLRAKIRAMASWTPRLTALNEHVLQLLRSERLRSVRDEKITPDGFRVWVHPHAPRLHLSR